MKKSKPPPALPKRPSRLPNHQSSFPPKRPSNFPKINADDEERGTTGTTDTRTFAKQSLSELANETLTVLSGAEEGRVFTLGQGDVWIGRGDDCDIIIADKGLSRRHACITLTPGTVMLRDNRAKNGTFVNDARIDEHRLTSGDEIQLGPSVCLLFSRARGLAERYARAERDKIDSIASMVAGVAHEINTPLGVANTANAIIESLTEEVRRNPSGERVNELLADLRASAGLVSKNLERTNQLVRLFKQLSAHEAMDERRACDLASIVEECIDEVKVETSKRNVTIHTQWYGEMEFPWVGYPASMSKVLEHLLRNTLRYAYKGNEGGTVDIRLTAPAEKFRLEVEDYGIGVAPEIEARLFQPFVTSGRETGAAGLGLAVVRNIVANLFGGTITCTSRVGKGTKFVVTFPRVAPREPLI
jgi:signal transduction histidine kinase